MRACTKHFCSTSRHAIANFEGLLHRRISSRLQPRAITSAFIHLYRFIEDGRKLELVHKTLVEDVPCALCPFQGRLLVTVGKVLRIYDLGKRKLLRKCEQKNFPNFLVSLSTTGDRIVVGDVAESFHFVKYKRHENQLNIFADDSIPRYCGRRPGLTARTGPRLASLARKRRRRRLPGGALCLGRCSRIGGDCRWVTSQTLLDHDTVAGPPLSSPSACNIPFDIANAISL